MAKVSRAAGLSRRERQIMDVLYRRGRSSVSDVLDELPERRSYSTVRALLRILEEKGHVRHEEESMRYVYVPAVPRGRARRWALAHLMETFFEGSVEQVMSALLDPSITRISNEQIERLDQLIHKARKGRKA